MHIQLKLHHTHHLLYQFPSFEHLIQLSHTLNPIPLLPPTLYHYQAQYFLTLHHFQQLSPHTLISILPHFASPTTLTIHRLKQYGKVIM
ncbi:adaptor protein MecA, partial [Bacillus pumilus]|uniref:adaptor protein MecA n=1 Tax=Bacillus pumilus TaxID=1408 RepID=UPI0028CB7B3C